MKIVCRAPVRVNLANGGDTDYFIEQIGWGCVINATLSSHFYEFEINDQQKSKIEIVDYFNQNSLNRRYYLDEEISELDLIKATLNHLTLDIKNSYTLRTNVPMKSGLGGSSALHTAMLAVLLKYKNEEITPEKIAQLAYHIERNVMNVKGGYQDQYASAYGKGFNYIEFKKDKITVKNLKIKESILKKLENNLLLYYVKKREISGTEIHKEQEQKTERNPEEIKKLLIEKRTNVLKIKQALTKGKLDEFGKLLMKEGSIKNKITGNKGYSFAQNIINKAVEAGATGYKVSGAGGGGCILIYAPTDSINRVKSVIAPNEATELKFRFQRSFEPGIMLK